MYAYFYPDDPGKIKLGDPMGDMLRVPLAGLDDCEGVVCGPMCTPWAANGAHEGATDPKADCYERSVEWIIELGHRGCLLWYALENSPTIRNAEANRSRAPWLQRMMLKLEAGLPFFVHGAVDSPLFPKLPHKRNRCVLRGMRRDVMTYPSLPAPLGSQPRIKLKDVLNFDLPNMLFAEVATELAQKHLVAYAQKIASDVSNGISGDYAVV